MDPVSLATELVGAQMNNAQMAIAAKMLRMNADSQGAIVQVLEAAQQNYVGDGVGQNLNISA